MSQIVIGKAGQKSIALDLPTLLATRLLVTSDSGGGKTWLLKRLIEQAFGRIRILVIDPEGEFSPLREHFDFVLVGKGGETPADVRSAAKVARTLLQARASAICDIYEMKPSERHEFVRAFLDALIEAPKELRHPYLVIVDEAHIFCPEHGKGESLASDSMIGLCTRGRKRLLCAIFATQRLATLNKDASGMLLNRLVGPTFEDVNRKRAVEVLSVAKEDVAEFRKKIQTLEPGNFYALGRAITKELLLVHVGGIETVHGQEALKYELTPPPPTAKIRAMLPKLVDLPKAAEEEARTIADYKKQVRELKLKLRTAPKEEKHAAPVGNSKKATAVRIEYEVITPQRLHAVFEPLIKSSHAAAAKSFDAWRERILRAIGSKPPSMILDWERVLRAAAANLSKGRCGPRGAFSLPAGYSKILGGEIQRKVPTVGIAGGRNDQRAAPPIVRHPLPELSRRLLADRASDNGDAAALTPYQRDILRGLAELEAIGRSEVPRGLAGAASGKSHKSSTFERYVAALRSQGLIEYRGSKLALTDAGRELAGDVDQSLSADDVQDRLLEILTPYQRDIVKALIDAGGDVLSWDELGEKIGKSAASSTFERYMASLRSAEIIEYAGSKSAKAAAWLFLE
ncbi:MAG: helicase HerA domain-containing protein [Candidatus Acidiferrales bacterium]